MVFFAPAGGRIGSFIASRLARRALSAGRASELFARAAQQLDDDIRAIGEYRYNIKKTTSSGVDFSGLGNGQRAVLNTYCRDPMVSVARGGGSAEEIAAAGNSADFTGSLSETIQQLADAFHRAVDAGKTIKDLTSEDDIG